MHPRHLVAMLVLIFGTPVAHAQADAPIILDVKLGAKVDLKRFGGYDMDFIVKSIDPLRVCTVTIDRTKMVTRSSSSAVAVTGYDNFGLYTGAAATSSSQTVPTVTPSEIPLTNGIAVEGATLQKLYLLYEDDKIAVYYHDTIATSAGACRLRVKTKPKG